jgi:hypothetical protein
MTIITVIFHENLCVLMTVSRCILLRMRNVPDKRCRENQNIDFVLNDMFPKIVPFVGRVGKIWYSLTGHR